MHEVAVINRETTNNSNRATQAMTLGKTFIGFKSVLRAELINSTSQLIADLVRLEIELK
jgi:hypothetical protein